mgnify:CR=1 FL=1
MKKSDLRDMLTVDIEKIGEMRTRWMNVLYEGTPAEDHINDLPKAERIAIDRACFSLNILSTSFDHLADVIELKRGR